jgi:uncharacterized membrane protein YjgN (DUF898 family)
LSEDVVANPFARPDEAPTLAPEKTGPTRIRFTGDGAEYFKIWITNLLLTFITLGFYSPWAKVRREKYFRQNTYIGDSNMDYHGDPKSILFGRIFALGLLAISLATNFSVALAFGAAVVVALALPWAMRSSIKFRFHNTSYQGLRFGFAGTVGRAYAIALPLSIAGIGVVILPRILEALTELSGPKRWMATFIAISALILSVYGPAFAALWRKFAINHGRYGTVFTHTDMTVWGYIGQYFKAALIPILILLGIIILIATTGVASLIGGRAGAVTSIIIVVAVIALYFVSLMTAPLILARLQNYVWNGRTSIVDANNQTLATFASDLRAREYIGLQIKNYLLLGVTGGLYRPFMAVNNAKARLEAISISDLSFVDTVKAQKEAGNRAFGAEAVDAFDFDISL